MSRVLILDTATKTGWTFMDDDVVDFVEGTGLLRLDAGLKGIPASAIFQRQPLILANAHRDVGALIDRFNPDFIVAEIPHLRGASSFLTVAIYGVVELLCAQRGIGFYGVHTASWQSRILPAPKGAKKVKGDTKQRSIAHVKALGATVETDDVADAICIAEYVSKYLHISGGAVL